jgi:hypothetical protein
MFQLQTEGAIKMMYLAATCEIPEPLSVFDQACRLLRDNLRQEPQANLLWTNGRWQPATLDDIMKRANLRLKSLGRPQFTGKADWIIS